MSEYTLNGNIWGGSFILEASTDRISWEPMVAKSSNNTFLGREGLSTTGGNISSGYNSNSFSNTTFSIYKPLTYTAVSGLTNLTGTITAGQVSNFSISLIGYSQDNTVNDFSAHISTGAIPTLGGTFKYNCVIKTYINGVLNIDAIVMDLTTTQTLTVLVRSPSGSGVTTATLTTSVSVAVPPTRSITHTGTLSLNSPGTMTFTISPTPLSNSNVKVYYDTISTSLLPTQCGTGTSTGSTATTSCTITTPGKYYLYISLDIDVNKISSTSGLVYVGVKILLQTNPIGNVYSDSGGTILATTGSNVRVWKDLAGSYNYISNSSSPYPTYATIGGVNGILFGNGSLSTVNAFLSSGMTNCTFEILVYLTSNARSTFYVRQNPGYDTYDWIFAENGNIFWHKSNNTLRFWNTGASAPLNSWQHYVIVSNSGIYRNGSKESTFTYSYSSAVVPDNQVLIGWNETSNHYISEYNVYSSEMTAMEVTTLYNGIRTKHNI